MALILFGDKEIKTNGELPEIAYVAPDFYLRNVQMQNMGLKNFKNERLILNVFPSIDTNTCATSVRKFNTLAASLPNTKVLCISRDLPMAQKRFCGAEGIENVIMLSDFQYGSFGEAYGLTIEEGPFEGLHARAVIVLNEKHEVLYTELVSIIGNEPNYDEAIKALQ
jgi:thiol peroxidase